jgi:hypothetical protein
MTVTDMKHVNSRGVLPAVLLGILILFSSAGPASAQIQQRMGFQPGQVNVPGYYDLTRPRAGSR